MAAINTNSIQVLLEEPHGQGMTVSCYADTSVTEGFERHWLQPFKTEASQARQRLAHDHQAQHELERNLEIIERALDSPEAHRARGMAVFSAEKRGFFLALPATLPYQNRLVVDEKPYVVPLLEADFRRRGYLAVLLDTHRGRWYAAGPAGARLLGEIDEAVPRKQRAAGERLGKKQAAIARHRKDHILHVHKELARRVAQAFGKYPYQGIVLLGEHEVLENFRAQLPPRVSECVVLEAPHAWAGEPAEIDERVRALLEGALAKEETRVLAEVDRRLHEATAVATGAQEVIECLKNGQVAALVLGPDQGASAWSCPRCGALFAVPHAVCTYCRGPCATSNLWQEILAFALRHGIWVHCAHRSPALARFGGVAALLAQDEPPWGPAEAGALREMATRGS